MTEADFYPSGAYNDPNAPYNEQIIPKRDFDVRVTQSLVKDTTIFTDQYKPEYDEENGHTYTNTDDTDWKDAYEEVSFTPIMLIDVCKKIAQWAIDNGTKRIDSVWLPSVVKECDGWEVDETKVEER